MVKACVCKGLRGLWVSSGVTGIKYWVIEGLKVKSLGWVTWFSVSLGHVDGSAVREEV